jgi:hypothetical protein
MILARIDFRSCNDTTEGCFLKKWFDFCGTGIILQGFTKTSTDAIICWGFENYKN